MTVELKIKAKSLAAEAKIIRLEELKLRKKGRGPETTSLHLHRTIDVRQTARATHLVRACLRGVPYRALEHTTRQKMPDTVKLQAIAMLTKYGEPTNKEDAKQRFDLWLDAEAA